MILYFSGTGNSRHVAKRMAAELDDQLSWPMFALLGFPMPERLALLFFLIGGADLFRKLSQERDELVRKLLRLKLPGGRKGVTEQ